MRPIASYAWALAAGLLSQAGPFGPPTVAVQRYGAPHPGTATVDVSGDGRFVAFESFARLLPLDRNSAQDIYVLDRSSDQLALESLSYDGHCADGSSSQPRLSGDGRYLVFESVARNLVPDWPQTGDEPAGQVYLRDRQARTTTLVSRAVDRTLASRWSTGPDVSDDGRWVVFESAATNLVAVADANGNTPDVYLFNVQEQTITRVSVDRLDLQPPHGASGNPRISGDGRYVAFASSAPLDDAVPSRRARSTPPRQVFLRDVRSATTRLVSRTSKGTAGDGGSSYPALSADGRFVAFTSTAGDLPHTGEKAENGVQNVFMYDAVSGQVALVSRTAAGTSGNGRSRFPAISGNGQYIVFESDASDLACDRRCPGRAVDLNLVSDVYVLDRLAGHITRVSGLGAGPDPWWQASAGAAIDASGSVVAFSSLHPMNSADLASDYDLFIRVRP